MLSSLLLRVSSSHFPPTVKTVGNRWKREDRGAYFAFRVPVHFSVIQKRLSLATRVPPARVSVLVKLRRSNKSGPEVWRMVHSHDSALGRVAVKPTFAAPPSLAEKPRSSAS